MDIRLGGRVMVNTPAGIVPAIRPVSYALENWGHCACDNPVCPGRNDGRPYFVMSFAMGNVQKVFFKIGLN